MIKKKWVSSTWVSYLSTTIDKEIKKEAEKIIRKLGYTPTSVIKLFYEMIIENRQIPFDIPQHNKEKKVGYMCRIDKKIKEEADKIIKSLGLTPTSLFNIFYNEIIRHQGLPFKVKVRLNNNEEEK